MQDDWKNSREEGREGKGEWQIEIVRFSITVYGNISSLIWNDEDKAIQLNPSYAKAFANRGITLARMGDRQGAIADLQQAARLFKAQGMNADAQKALDAIGQLQR